MTKIRIISLILVGSIGYIVWALMAYADPAQRADFLKFNILMASGVIGLVLRDLPSGNVAPPAPLIPPPSTVAPTVIVKE